MKKLLATLSQQIPSAQLSIATPVRQKEQKNPPMTRTTIENLTLAQKGLISDYREKWRAIALSPGPIDPEKATAAINAAYGAIGKPAPQIVFFDSPYRAFRKPQNILASLRGALFRGKIEDRLGIKQTSSVRTGLENQFSSEGFAPIKRLLWSLLGSQLARQVGNPVWHQLRSQLDCPNDNCIQPELWAYQAGVVDFCISVLNCEYDLTKWQALQSVVKECGWIFPWEKICYVCDRPTKISFDRQRLIHAETEPAILFADGFKVYAYHGTVIPEKYGLLTPLQWQPQWIIQEQDIEVKRALIHGIGLVRIRRDLGKIDLNF